MAKYKKKDYAVHFPAYSIAKGELSVGSVSQPEVMILVADLAKWTKEANVLKPQIG